MIKAASNILCEGTIIKEDFISQNDLISKIKNTALKYGLNLIVEEDFIKVGGGHLIGTERCVTVYNANHKKDYFGYAIVQRSHIEVNFIYLYLIEKSKSLKIYKNARIKSIGLFSKDEDLYYQMALSVINEAVEFL